VALNVRLVNPADREIVAQTSFEQRQRAPTNDVPSIILAFNKALGTVMRDIVVWTATNPALLLKRG
jgi:cholesterol transport system auxiliary component